METRSIGFIGGGRVAHIILGGWAKAGKLPDRIVVSDVSVDVLNRLQARFPGIRITPNDNKAPASQEMVFLGLHPPAVAGCLTAIKSCLKPDAILISLVPKLSIARLSENLGGFKSIVRLIPNAPSIIGEGYNPVVFSGAMNETKRAEVRSLLDCLGKCPEVEESKLEAYAIVTAMGPTYLWFQLNELQLIAESFGLSHEEATAGIAGMVAGTGKTLFQSGLPAEQVIDLIPVKPLGEEEVNIKSAYHARLEGLYQKLKS
jgi:pyrroline-5-carboxylate reductase